MSLLHTKEHTGQLRGQSLQGHASTQFLIFYEEKMIPMFTPSDRKWAV